MPCLKVFTNVSKNKIPADFAKNIIPILSETVGKPPTSFVCMVTGDCSLFFQGDGTSPSAVATLESIGHVDPERNKEVSKQVSEYIFKTIGVKSDKFFLSFFDMEKSNIGISGTTVAVLEK